MNRFKKPSTTSSTNYRQETSGATASRRALSKRENSPRVSDNAASTEQGAKSPHNTFTKTASHPRLHPHARLGELNPSSAPPSESRHPLLVEAGHYAAIAAALLLTACALTFRSALPRANLFGLIGHLLGYGLLFFLGILTYPMSALYIWGRISALRALRSKVSSIDGKPLRRFGRSPQESTFTPHMHAMSQTPSHIWGSWEKRWLLSILFISSSLLLAQVGYTWPSRVWEVCDFIALEIGDPRYIAGYPAAFIYRQMPWVNAHILLGESGVTTLFGSSAALTLFLLYRLRTLRKRALATTTPFSSETSMDDGATDAQSHSSSSFPSRRLTQLLRRQQEVHLKTFDTPASPEVAPSTTAEPSATAAASLVAKHAGSSQETTPASDHGVTSLSFLKAAKRKQGTGFILPNCSLLTPPKPSDRSQLTSKINGLISLLEETLLSFGIEAKVGQVHVGPRILSFEVHPSIGVKVQRIKALESDLALNLQAPSIRIIAPIPGKAAVGIEIPSPSPQEVNFQAMVKSHQKSSHKYAIPVILGKTVSGEDITFDLAKMPHMIIAGATGSGKSVCINTIIMSIVMHAKPDEIKLLMVDPKKVELTPYSRLPHMLAPVITEPQQAADSLKWLVGLMEKRYEILKALGLRNIQAFNQRKRHAESEEAMDIDIPEKMPYVVGIIDELADLMMTAPGDIETPVARIAQMARAVGIHLILATQRPSREVITGLIKANFPARISFRVASKINSQIILDETGAESLLGNGDMLFLHPSRGFTCRAQGVFISDADISKVLETIQMQAPPDYWITPDRIEAGNSSEDDVQDPLYAQARLLVIQTQNASTTFLQRKLRVGYARAASLMDQLEACGVVGAADGTKGRRILVSDSDDDQE